MPANRSKPKGSIPDAEHFLEVSVAIEVCEVFGARRPSASEVAKLLVYYAENDAFPAWVYSHD